jgi:hypothetical protein
MANKLPFCTVACFVADIANDSALTDDNLGGTRPLADWRSTHILHLQRISRGAAVDVFHVRKSDEDELQPSTCDSDDKDECDPLYRPTSMKV